MEDILNSAKNSQPFPVHSSSEEYKIKNFLPKSNSWPQHINSELILFLGAGASIPAGVPGVEKMVDEFLAYLSNERYFEYLEVITDIVHILKEWEYNKKID